MASLLVRPHQVPNLLLFVFFFIAVKTAEAVLCCSSALSTHRPPADPTRVARLSRLFPSTSHLLALISNAPPTLDGLHQDPASRTLAAFHDAWPASCPSMYLLYCFNSGGSVSS
ncbi:hypothetical protein IWX90DRAFT_63818 [Phyllosticta citrichinensis]|uniref:Secreted protein n=1 Tax=Phyllosticta citrichinensis TaxID=1130410 RepID=A0ABR1XHK3_9PEZI